MTTAHISKHNDLLLLDYDGVVADSLPAIREHTAAFCRERGLGQGLASAAIACMRSATLAGLIEAAGITGEHVREYGRYLFRELNSNPSRVPLFDGIPELLRDLATSYTLCIVSANHSTVVRQRLESAGLVDLMAHLYGNEQPGGKAEHIRQAMASHGGSTESTWMIGDTVGDIRAAKQAGVHAVAVTWGWQSLETLERAGPNLIFEQPEVMHRYFSGQPGAVSATHPDAT